MLRFKLIVLLNIFIHSLFASVVDNGYKALLIHDYFKAKKIFTQNLRRQPVASAYGLATIYYRNNNPFHNLDSAYKYGMMAKFSFDRLTQIEKQKLFRWKITDTTIQGLCQYIFRDSYQKLNFEIQKNTQNSLMLTENYLQFHEFSSYWPMARKLRDELLLNEIKKSNSSESYQKFLLEWPECYCRQEINYLLEKAYFEEETALQTPESYLKFLANHPETPFKSRAQEEVFSIYKKNQNAARLYEFIKLFPENEHVQEAWKLFFTLRVEQYSAESLAEFIFDYPEFPFKNSIVQEIQTAKKELIRVKRNEKFGYIDSLGKWSVNPEFDELSTFNEGLAVASINEKFGYINKNGEWIIQPIYDEAENFQNGVAIVILNEKSLLIDRNGEIINNEFDEINNFSDGLAVVKKGNLFGAINRLGKIVIPVMYEKLNDFKSEHAVCSNGSKFGIIDKNNYISIKIEYDWMDEFSPLIRAKKNGLYGVIKSTENTIIPFEFERIEKTNCHAFLLVKNSKYGFADETGCMITDINSDFDNKFQTDDLCSVSESDEKLRYFKIYQNENIIIINQNGKIMFDGNTFDEVLLPSDGLVCTFKKEKYEFYDLKQTKIIRQNFDKAERFFQGKAIVRKNDKKMIIDTNGKELFADNCENIERLKITEADNYFLITKNGLKGLLNKDLRWIIAAEYQEISLNRQGFISLQKEGKNSVFSLSQNKIIWTE